MMQDEWQFAWFCICILEGGHVSIPDADADPRMTGLALTHSVLPLGNNKGYPNGWDGMGLDGWMGWMDEIVLGCTNGSQGDDVTTSVLDEVGRGGDHFPCLLGLFPTD
jgi:hypothetical protein